MAKQRKNKKFQWQQYTAVAFFLLLGAVCGVLMVLYLEASATADRSPGEELLTLLSLFFLMYVAIFIHLIVHEAGHLVFGLLTGYRFSSFRILSFLWIREEGRLRLRRLSVAGTGGQCLMIPPDPVDGRFPVLLYNLGGSLMNLALSLLCLGLYWGFGGGTYAATAALLFLVVGLILAAMNGIPMRMGQVDNDGYNALALGRDPVAMRAFWIQLKINEQIARGVRLKEMPEEWFLVPDDRAMKNSLTAAIGAFSCNRLMDEHRFAEADAQIAQLLSVDSGMPGIYRDLLRCDRLYIELITQNRREAVEDLRTKELQKFMKSMKTFPSVLRTEYAYARLALRESAQAERIRAQFEKRAKHYPYPSDIQSERELIELAEKKEEA